MIGPTTTVHGSAGLQALVDALRNDGYEVLGPRVVDGVVEIRPLTAVADLPLGWSDEQAPGAYRERAGSDGERFGYAVGAQSWKPLLHRPRVQTLSMTTGADTDPAVGVRVEVVRAERSRRAFVGVRPCELAAIGRHDTVLIDGPLPDRSYRAARSGAFVVVVECTRPAGTCFCASMATGPTVADPAPAHDLVVSEIPADERGRRGVRYAITPASGRGDEIAEALRRVDPGRAADDDDIADLAAAVDTAVAAMGRRLDTGDVHDLLLDSYEAGTWESIAERCLACGNCTAVCPTCFCTTSSDVTDLSGTSVERWREWDTCFSLEFSRLGSGVVRESVASRYRQWLVHKLGTWHDQFGESGCVGCGRCITWCPVGIDLTAEIPRLREAAVGDAR